MVLHAHSLARTTTTSRARSRCRSARCSAFRSRARTRRRRRATSCCSPSSVVLTWFASNLVHGRIGRIVDGGAGHGHRGRTDGHPAAAHQAARLRGVVLSTAASPARSWCSLVRRRGVRRVQHQPVLLHPVHGDHRRAGQPDRLVLRRGAHLHPADRARQLLPARPSAFRSPPRRSSTCASWSSARSSSSS